MRPLLIAALLTLTLCGCGNVAAPLTPAEKGRFLSETLEPDGSCGIFRSRLREAAAAPSALDLIYADAKRAGCLRRDI